MPQLRFAVLPLLAASLLSAAGENAAPPTSLMPRAEDFTRMFWAEGFPARVPGARWERVIRTGSYALAMETDTLRITHLGALASEKAYASSAYSTDAAWKQLPPADLKLEIAVNGRTYRATGASKWTQFDGPRLIESGRFFQRADITGLVFTDDQGNRLNTDARLEIAAWPDRLSFFLAARPGLEEIKPGEASFGRIGGGFGFDGSNHLEIPHSPELEPENLTLELWAFVPEDFHDSTKAYPWLVCKNPHEEAEGNYGFSLIGGRAQARLNIGGGRANAFKAESRERLKTEAWNHLALTYDGQTLRLYLNGEAAGETIVGKKRVPGNKPLAFGRRQDNSGDGYHFRGVIDEVRLHGRALTAQELKASSKLAVTPSAGAKPLKEWSFRTDGTGSDSRPAAPWSGASLNIALSKGQTSLREVSAKADQNTPKTAPKDQIILVLDPVGFEKLNRQDSLDIQASEVVGGKTRPVSYEPELNCHRVDLDGVAPVIPPGSGDRRNDALERVRLVLTNTSGKEEVARLLFAKEKGGFRHGIGSPITGVSAVLRDRVGNPTGIPVQLSKNWHNRPEGGVHSGQWFHGFSMVRLPPNSTTELELTLAYGHWGSLPAASHAQLCLVGWGSNQLWDQAAVGSWGESVCFEPDQVQASATVTDVRPLMVKGMGQNDTWGWTHNVGGADFFRLFDPAGQRVPPSAMRTTYLKQGPCLTEVVYFGQLGAGLDHSVTASLSRTDDLTRATYRLRLDAREPAAFSRLVLLQIGADTYSYTGERMMAFGNAAGLTREWPTQWGGDVYRSKPEMLSGPNPWISLHQAVPRREKGQSGAWANRGLVIHSWKARLGGLDAAPWFAEYGVKARGPETSTVDLLPPPGVTRLEPGDFVEAVIEHLVIPQSAADYYGPNQALRQALKTDADTWRMVRREAGEGARTAEVSTGTLRRLYPSVSLQARDNAAEFTLSGGTGFVPVTFSGLTRFPRPVLLVDGKPLDQSVHGNDFWQTDYDPETSAWSVTFNLPASPSSRRLRLELR